MDGKAILFTSTQESETPSMSDDYFNLMPEVQKSLLQAASNQLNISDVAIEKDIWVCWVLKQLFTLPISMAFKGGTSLSKAYDLINRFSEDVDITIDYRNFMDAIDIEKASRSKLKRISEELKTNLAGCIQGTILPFLNDKALQLPKKVKVNIESDGKETLRLYYPSVLFDFYTDDRGNYYFDDNGERYYAPESEGAYLRDHILIEFGVRNRTEPHERRTIKTLLSQLDLEKPLSLPEASVDVLSVIRTLWEKATLIHVECHRKRLRENSDRLSRHWYDLAMLINAGLHEEALAKQDILESVVAHKKAFFNASYTNYNDCLNGKFRLIPDKEDEAHLKRDYDDMVQSGMFSKEPIQFKTILEMLENFEEIINR